MAFCITNRLYLPLEAAEKVLDFIGGAEPLDFNSVQPVPNNLTPAEKKEWCAAFWGTEENAANAELEANILTFQTADAPPVVWLQELSAQFPSYDFTLDWFYDDRPDAGQYVVRGGKVQYSSVI